MIVLLSGLAAQADVTINSTNFPDANFRSYLLSLYPSGYITTAQLNSRTRLDVSRQYISSLQGIKFFTALTSLDCSDNNLTWLNLNANTQLEDLDCSGNGMTSLEISDCSNLVYLFCGNNSYNSLYINDHYRLCQIDVSNCKSLNTLCTYRTGSNGPLNSSLNVTGCTALKTIKCYSTPNLFSITGLADCTALTYLDCNDCKISDLSALNSLSNIETVELSLFLSTLRYYVTGYTNQYFLLIHKKTLCIEHTVEIALAEHT